jgi:hypothetical protein
MWLSEKLELPKYNVRDKRDQNGLLLIYCVETGEIIGRAKSIQGAMQKIYKRSENDYHTAKMNSLKQGD